MNERIKTLFIQAGGGVEEENGNLWTYSEDLDPEKFAQLILIEVTDILSTYRGKVVFEDGAEYNYQHPIIAIRKHFGVKE